MRSSFTTIVKHWRLWGIPALIELLAPWQDKVTGLVIISDYWQPGLNAFCSAAGAMSALFVFAFLHDQSRAKQRTWAGRLACSFVFSFVTALGFHLTVGDAWFPEGLWRQIVLWLWWLSYVLVFVTSGGLIIALLLASTKR